MSKLSSDILLLTAIFLLSVIIFNGVGFLVTAIVAGKAPFITISLWFGIACLVAVLASVITVFFFPKDKEEKLALAQAPTAKTYIAFRNANNSTIGLYTKENYNLFYPGGIKSDPPKLILEFKANSREEATIRYNKFLNNEL